MGGWWEQKVGQDGGFKVSRERCRDALVQVMGHSDLLTG